MATEKGTEFCNSLVILSEIYDELLNLDNILKYNLHIYYDYMYENI